MFLDLIFLKNLESVIVGVGYVKGVSAYAPMFTVRVGIFHKLGAPIVGCIVNQELIAFHSPTVLGAVLRGFIFRLFHRYESVVGEGVDVPCRTAGIHTCHPNALYVHFASGKVNNLQREKGCGKEKSCRQNGQNNAKNSVFLLSASAMALTSPAGGMGKTVGAVKFIRLVIISLVWVFVNNVLLEDFVGGSYVR